MLRQYQFRYVHAPSLTDYLPLVGTAVLAICFSGVAIIGSVDASQRAGNALDDYSIWLVAAVAWALPAFFGLSIWRRVQANREGRPAIAVDNDGITLPGWTGKPLDLKWLDVTDLEFEQVRGKSHIWIRTGTVAGAVPLDGLDVHPVSVWEVIKQCRESS